MADGYSNIKRQRVSKACEQCRRKKVKCDGGLPLCNNCVTLGLQCTYKESTKKRGPPKGYIEAIEGRLHRLEALLGSIIQDDDPRFKAIIDELNSPLETMYGELVRPRPMRRPSFAGIDGELGPFDDRPSTEFPEHHPQRPIDKSKIDTSNDHLGSLSIDAGGQVRYYGKSSGYYMLRSRHQLLHDGTFPLNTKRLRSGDTESRPPPVVDPFEMPPKDLEDHLLEIYFRHFYSLIPLLHKKTFMRRIQTKDDRPPALLLNAIFAIASRISPDIRVRADPMQPDTAGDAFFERARMLLDLEWDSFRVYTVQALLLMSSHQNGALKTVRGWLYSGMAFRMSQNLGLHRNCDGWQIPETEKEERKRAFYGCLVVDRLSSAMHGRSPLIDERDYDTPYPAEIDEDEVEGEPPMMGNFHQMIKLCELLGEILRALYTVKGRKQLSQMTSTDEIVSCLDRKLNRWMSKLPPSLQYHPPNTRLAQRAPAPPIRVCQLHMLFYTTLILLHRPFIPGTAQEVTPSVFPSSSICTFAANNILDIVESLLAEGRLNHINNYSLYFLFTAGIIFIHNAASPDSMFSFEAKISTNKIMKAMDELETTWMTSARHCNILGALAGLRDIDLESVDESFTKLAAQRSKVPPFIAVPNSPNPMFESGDEQQDSKDFLTMNNGCGQKPPMDYYVGTRRSISSQSRSPEQTMYGTGADGLQPPGSYNPYFVMESTPVTDRPFNPNGTAFWDVPVSFDLNDWTSYFNNQSDPNKQQTLG
ncbi:fungal-specific transcription factor domain-containing protein [Radiomyces spectabilis]|uniref:fungal-specific transcription factor domain-containing protein n=1 Tax=Radiomyces spectabilis TaxID=64574 RepID=UPI00221FC7B0|nr:fungal-specific transcription factor domain-containing protein [Radiomyces spectabilis]KAI8393395.1 fungal-specific transcription factor domain-containing protein [Radiomyces spectabilis]